MQGFILINNAEKNEQATDEEDPYAAYVIPDDLMWVIQYLGLYDIDLKAFF